MKEMGYYEQYSNALFSKNVYNVKEYGLVDGPQGEYG